MLVLLRSCPKVYILPSLLDGLPGLHHRNFKELHDFMDCFLDQMGKVQAPAILNSIHATHNEAPSTQQQPSPLFAGTD